MGPLAIVTYLIVYGKTRGEHDSKLAMLFQQPKERSLTLNREKCLCSLPRLTSFGCVISTDGTFPDNKKVEVILETRAPSNLAEVHSFLGLVTCCSRRTRRYRKFLELATSPFSNVTNYYSFFVDLRLKLSISDARATQLCWSSVSCHVLERTCSIPSISPSWKILVSVCFLPATL